jgi:hypothetical protein
VYEIVVDVLCSVVLAIVASVSAQSNSTFAAGEGQRLYDLLDGLGCIGNENCTRLGDFTPTTACDYKPNTLICNDDGLLVALYVDLVVSGCGNCVVGNRSDASYQRLTGTFASNLNTFSALTWLYVLFRVFQICKLACSHFFPITVTSTATLSAPHCRNCLQTWNICTKLGDFVFCSPFDALEMCRDARENQLEGQLPPFPASLTHL